MFNQAIINKLKELIDKLKNRVGHHHCFTCRQRSHYLVCNYCLHDTVLPLFPSPGHNLLDLPSVYEHIEAPAYEALYALSHYDGVVSGLVNQLKFSNKPLAADALCRYFEHYMFTRMRISQSIPEALVPIPLSDLRYINRYYNQSRLLAQNLAQKLDIACIDLLKRTRHTKQQTSLSKEGRQQNIIGAFAVQAPLRVDSIAVVDDVITTGATINEACRTIACAYPDVSISAWCIAVTPAHTKH
jgi:ComF family protein